MKPFWDERYADSAYAYGTAPNIFFEQTIAALAPGRLLLPGEGEGRNAVHAAGKGWQVRAVDYSEEGKRKAMELARSQDVGIEYEVADLETFVPEQASYDAIALIFVHLPPQLRRLVHQRCIDALRPGGRLLIEAFTPRQLDYSSGGPRSADLLYTAELLLEDCVGLSIAMVEERIVTLREGPFHDGEAAVVRLIAERGTV